MIKTEGGKECYFKVVLSQSKKLNPPTKVKDGRNEKQIGGETVKVRERKTDSRC